MSSGIIYLLTGTSHAVRLVVSLWSLRKHYQGPVTLYWTTEEAGEVVARCMRDDRLRIDVRNVAAVEAPRNVDYLTKIRALEESPFELTLYLDADTLIVGSIEELLQPQEGCAFTATCFADWSTSTPIIRNRIKPWQGLRQAAVSAEWIDSLVERSAEPRPAINAGVVGVPRNSPVLKTWLTLALAGCRTFICDEIALQLLLAEFPHHLLDCRYNCSPVYAADQADARIWHFHGSKHLRPSPASDQWRASFWECMRENVAGLADWAPAGDRPLAEYLAAASDGAGEQKVANGIRVALAN